MGRSFGPTPQELAIAELKPADALALYNAWVESVAVATHRARLRFARGFFAWAIDRGYVTRKPFAAVGPIGKPAAASCSPAYDEARKLYAELFRLAWAGNPGRLSACSNHCRARGLARSRGLRVRGCRRRCHAAACCRRRRQDSKRDAHPRDRCPRPARPFATLPTVGSNPATIFFSHLCDGSTNSALYKYPPSVCPAEHPQGVRPHALRETATLAVQQVFFARRGRCAGATERRNTRRHWHRSH